MIANPDMNNRRENQITHKLKIYNNEIEGTKSVKLLSIAGVFASIYSYHRFMFRIEFSCKGRRNLPTPETDVKRKQMFLLLFF